MKIYPTDLTAAGLAEMVETLPNEAWPEWMDKHDEPDDESPERFWFIYGPMGKDDKRCVHIGAKVAALAFVGSMTAWLHTFGLYLVPIYWVKNKTDGRGYQLHGSDLKYKHLWTESGKSLPGDSLIEALAAACKGVSE